MEVFSRFCKISVALPCAGGQEVNARQSSLAIRTGNAFPRARILRESLEDKALVLMMFGTIRMREACGMHASPK
jgi:hypothetical protein